MHSGLIGHITSVIGITVVKELKLKFGANYYFILKDEMYSFQSLTGPRNAFAIIHGLMRCDLHIDKLPSQDVPKEHQNRNIPAVVTEWKDRSKFFHAKFF